MTTFAVPLPCTPAERWGQMWRMGKGSAREVGDYTPETIDGRTRHRLTFWSDAKRYRIGSVPLPGGQRLPLESERMARELLMHLREQIQAGQPVLAVIAPYLARTSAETQVMTWAERWVERVAELAESGQRSPTYLRNLRSFVAPGGHFDFWRGRALWDVKPPVLDDFVRALELRGIGAKTRRNVVGAFGACLHWCERRGLLLQVPRMPTIEVDEHAATVLGADAQDAILEAISDERRGIFLALARLGLRPGEARALQLRDYRDGWITVGRAVKGLTHRAPVRGTKTRRVRRLPLDELGPDLAAWLARQKVSAEDRLRGTLPLFRDPRSRHPEKRWTYWALRDDWKAACTIAGVRAPLYEGTRHSLATAWLERGVRREIVQYLLGHADERTTRKHYQQVTTLAIMRELKGTRA